MAWSQADITAVNAPVPSGGQVYISWTSSAPADTWYQVYVSGELAWHGQTLGTWLPIPPHVVRIDVGTVDAGEELTDFSADLDAPPARTAVLTWLGGTFEADDLAGFNVYGEATPNAGINYTTPIAVITAYPSNVYVDGFGEGGFGEGGFGRSAGSYTWTSGSLEAGTWHYGVKPFDTSGNEGTTTEVPVTIAGPPTAPVPYADRTRLGYTYDVGTFTAVLTWNASPSL